MLYNNKYNKKWKAMAHSVMTCFSKQKEKKVAKSSEAMTVLQWQIVGMDCSSCAQRIEKNLNGIAAIESVQVVFATGHLKIHTRANTEMLHTLIKNQVNSLGFELSETVSPACCNNSHSLSTTEIKSMLMFAILIVFSFILQLYSPILGQYAFMVATLIGWLPIAANLPNLIRAGTFFSIELLTSISAIGALFIGAIHEAAMVLLLFRIGELLEGIATNNAKKGITALASLIPEEATKIVGTARVKIARHLLAVDDRIEAASGDRLPADVILMSPFALVDESALTGEPLPVEYQSGDKIMAGGLIIDHTVELQVVSTPGDNAIHRIIKLIEQAEDKKARVERFIERFSHYYTPAVILFAVLVAILPPLFMAGDWTSWIYRALTLLLIGCPCALVISTPASITSALSSAARQGVLIKGGAVLETLAQTKIIAFDKTGTLTLGKPHITDIVTETMSEAALLQQAAAVEIGSSHPLAKTIIAWVEQRYGKVQVATERQIIAGVGVQGKIGATRVILAAPATISQVEVRLSSLWKQRIIELENQAKTCVLVLNDRHIVGMIAFQDRIRDEAKMALNALDALGIHSLMLTGDNKRAARNLANHLGIDYRAELLPADKLKAIETLAAAETTVMIGDGINDSPAIKAATIGIAMGSGTDVALESADAALTKDNLLSLPKLIRLARVTNRNIRQNITLALGIKMLFLLTTLLGMTGLWVAVLADTGTTALVTANALRLLRFKK